MTERVSPPVIVVADDEEDILELVSIGLERAGYVIHRARDGEEALALACEHRPDVAILDVAMPKLDGFELTRRLRNDPETSEIKIVLLTARVQEADVDEGFRGGSPRLRQEAVQPAGASGPRGRPLAASVKSLLAGSSRASTGSRSRARSRSRRGPPARQLPAQVADVELDLVARGATLAAPDELEQLPVLEQLVGVLDERGEQPELERGQLDERRPR